MSHEWNCRCDRCRADDREPADYDDERVSPWDVPDDEPGVSDGR
jgi:hypothetical protein